VGKVTCDMTMSVDGFVAGPNQSLENAFGEGAEALHQWMFEEPDANAVELEAMIAAGAFIMGRNMFGPGRGACDEEWRGWWGEEPPVGCVNSIPLQMNTLRGSADLARASTLARQVVFLTHGQACALLLAQSHSLTDLN
jgi:hypothetical protein